MLHRSPSPFCQSVKLSASNHPPLHLPIISPSPSPPVPPLPLFKTEMEGVFFEMDSFADAVVLYCQKHLTSWDNAQQSEGGPEGVMEGGNDVESCEDRRPSEEKLCTIVAEQWRRSAAALARSRCVKGAGGAGATEQREVSEQKQGTGKGREGKGSNRGGTG